MARQTSVKPVRRAKSLASGFQGASYSNNRGYVYFPTLDTRREIDQYTRTEICRRARFLYANVGFVKRIIKGIARMALGGGLRPVFRTKDKDWNIAAASHFEARAGSAMTFDLGGRYNFYQAQRALLRAQLKDGDVFSVLSKTGMSGIAAVRIYEGHCVGNGTGSSAGDGDNWFDGVLVNNANRGIKYRLLNPDGTKALDVNAQDIIPFMDYERSGQSRGVSILAHAINNLLDSAEINGFLKQQVKVSSLVAYQITNATRKGGLGGNARPVRGKAADGTPIAARVEEALRGGKGVEMEPGAELKLVADERPHPNTLGYLDYLARDISWGCDFSPEILWDIHHLSGGPTRFVLADAQEVCDEIQADVRERFCRRYVNYFNSVEMNAKRLPRCKDPEWWLHDYVPPRKLTVDRGRDGKLYIELQGRGMLSLERWYSEQGLDWKREMTQFLDEKAWVKIEAGNRGLSMNDVYSAVMIGNSLNPSENTPAGGKVIVDPDGDPELIPETDPEGGNGQ